MSKRTFYQRYGRKLLQRGDPFVCHYCKRTLIEKGYKYGDPEFYDIVTEGFWARGGEYYTSTRITLKSAFGIASVDHITPRCEGGSDNLDNLVLACWECNTKKNINPYEKFVKGLAT